MLLFCSMMHLKSVLASMRLVDEVLKWFWANDLICMWSMPRHRLANKAKLWDETSKKTATLMRIKVVACCMRQAPQLPGLPQAQEMLSFWASLQNMRSDFCTLVHCVTQREDVAAYLLPNLNAVTAQLPSLGFKDQALGLSMGWPHGTPRWQLAASWPFLCPEATRWLMAICRE